jgi:hypothetical protein
LLDSAIPEKFKFNNENEIKDVVNLIENYTNRLALKSISLSEIDYSHLVAFFCLTLSHDTSQYSRLKKYPTSLEASELWKENE